MMRYTNFAFTAESIRDISGSKAVEVRNDLVALISRAIYTAAESKAVSTKVEIDLRDKENEISSKVVEGIIESISSDLRDRGFYVSYVSYSFSAYIYTMDISWEVPL